MENDKIIKLAAAGFVLLVAPKVINIVGNTAVGIYIMSSKVKCMRKINKGLRDGGVIAIDGQYYEVKVN